MSVTAAARREPCRCRARMRIGGRPRRAVRAEPTQTASAAPVRRTLRVPQPRRRRAPPATGETRLASRFPGRRLCRDTRALCVDGGHAHVSEKRIRAGGRLIPDVDAAAGRHAVGDLNRRVADDYVLTDLIPACAGEDHDPVRVADGSVGLDEVIGGGAQDADSEIRRGSVRVTVAARLIPPE